MDRPNKKLTWAMIAGFLAPAAMPAVDNAAQKAYDTFFHKDNATIEYVLGSEAEAAEKAYADEGLNYEAMAKKMEQFNQDKKYHKVITDFENFADDKENGSGLFYNELGVAFYKNKMYSKAIEAFQNSLEKRPNFAQTIFNLGGSYALTGEYKKALRCFESVEKLDHSIEGVGAWINYVKKHDKN